MSKGRQVSRVINPLMPTGRQTKKNMDVYLRHTLKRMERMTERIADLTRANNAASSVVACMERFLDDKFPGWDHGQRAELDRQTRLMRERKEIYDAIKVWKEDKEATALGGLSLANDLWRVAQVMNSQPQDAAMVVGLSLKADPAFALQVTNETLALGDKISPKLVEMLKKYKDHVEAPKAEQVAPPPELPAA